MTLRRSCNEDVDDTSCTRVALLGSRSDRAWTLLHGTKPEAEVSGVNGCEQRKNNKPPQAKVRGQAHGAAGILLWGLCDWVG